VNPQSRPSRAPANATSACPLGTFASGATLAPRSTRERVVPVVVDARNAIAFSPTLAK
jgi:hypothetical protein